MKASRRNFLAAGLALPAAGLANIPATGKTESPALAPEPSNGLTYRTIGKTGMKVTSVAFGCMITSDPAVIAKAADIGINYFDTARGYQGGQNERMVGAALKSMRKKLYISTKTHASTKDAALADLDKSLSELGTDYVDIWYLHGKTSGSQLLPELMEAQSVAKKAGKARFAGFSTHGGFDSVFPAAIAAKHFDVILTSYNFSMGDSIDKLIDDAKAAGIGVVAMKVMAGGFRRAKPGDRIYDTLKRDGAMVAALKWALRHPRIDTTIPSMTDMDQLDDNFKAMSASFGAGDEKLLATQLRHIVPLYCRGCGRCEGTCAKGLPVPDLVRFAMYADGYGQFPLGRERFLELPEDVRAVRCGDCAECTVQCRNGVRVSERVSRAQELFA